NKISENAAKFAAKGAWDKAIKEYELLLKLDPRDVRVLQKLGELQQKKGDNPAAANYFVKVAENFAGDGFFLKAVAQYKQALKLNPAQVELNLKLAELHQRLQLVGEAMAYLQVLANHYDQAGDVDRLLEILTRMVDLEPDNAGSRVKLGDLFAREKKVDRALLEYRRAADQYKRGNRMDDFVRVGERLLALEPNDGGLGKELARLYVQRAEHTRALGRIQPLFKADPKDPEVLELLAQAFEGLGQVSKAASTWKELARVQVAKGNADEAERAWGSVERLNPADGDVAARRAAASAAVARQVVTPPAAPPSAEPAPASAPAVAPTPRPAPAPASVAPPAPPTLQQLLADADVLLSQGQLQGAMERLYAVLAQEPENLDAHERAYNVYASAGDGASAFEQLLNVLRLCTRAADVARGQPYLDVLLAHSPSHPEVPAFVSVLRPSLAQPAGPTVEELEAAAAAQAAAERAEAERAAAERAATEAAARAEAERLAAERAAAERAAAERAAAERAAAERAAAERAAAESAARAAAERAEAERLAEERAAAERAAAERSVAEAAARAEAQRLAAPRDVPVPPAGPPPAYLNARCEQARVLFAEGRFLEGRMVLREVFAAEAAHPWAVSLRSWADQVSPETAESAAAPGASVESVADIAADISAELKGAPLVAAPEVEQVTAEQVFSEFKKGLARVVKPEDVETHYDLGIAYKEMGLLEDAASEFEIARQGCAGKRKEVDCLAMAALVHAATGRYDAAVGAYVQALRSAHSSGEVKKALLYDLAATREQMGSPGRALTHFLSVKALDGAYRDVAKVVARLEAAVRPEPDDLGVGGGAAA
ncbi:MAG: hypothetical protein RL653_1753, partial [Pseudomonadota bacterium]